MSEMRRKDMFSTEGRLSTRFRFLGVTAVAVVSALVGVAGARAAEGWERAWERELAIAEAEVSAELMEARSRLAREFLQQRLDDAEAGDLERDSVAMAELELRQVETQLAIARLDLEETRLTGSGARNELYAPLVDGRDFVSERIEHELALAMKRVDVARVFFDVVDERREAGLAESGDIFGAEQQVMQAAAYVDELRHRLELRETYLAEGASPRRIEAQARLSGARSRLDSAVQRLEMARREWERSHDRFDSGTLSRLDMMQAEYQLLELEAEVRLARMEYDFLEKRALTQ